MRRAQTEPANPAPTTSTSKLFCSGGKSVALEESIRMLRDETLAVGGDLYTDPRGELGVIASHGLREAVLDARGLDDHRRAPGLAQPEEQIGVLVPEDERGAEELAGRVEGV